jgi:hypothetical protein
MADCSVQQSVWRPFALRRTFCLSAGAVFVVSVALLAGLSKYEPAKEADIEGEARGRNVI